jgi:hypothetical protein
MCARVFSGGIGRLRLYGETKITHQQVLDIETADAHALLITPYLALEKARVALLLLKFEVLCFSDSP